MRGASASVFLILIILFIVIPPALRAETGTIHGILTDSATGEPLVGASVMVIGTGCGANTDFDGVFRIYHVDTGQCEIKISHLDYGTISIPDIIVKPGSYVALWKRLTRKSLELDVEITLDCRPETK